LGREIRELVASSGSELDLRLVAGEPEKAGTLTSAGDEPALMLGLDADSCSGVGIMLLAGSEASSRKALEFWDREPGKAVIDVTYVAEKRPEARLRAPLVEPETAIAGAAVQVIAHPAAIALALFFRRLHSRFPTRRSVVQVFAPASEHGNAGVEELQQQGISLFSFKSMPKAVFDAQLGFNLLARYGEQAPTPLEQTEARIERHLASLLALPGEGFGVPLPSLRVIQASVFHGYNFSVWAEFEQNPGVAALESALASEWIDVRETGTEPPTSLSQAGERGIAVGAVAKDRNNPSAAWFWVVADNLRLSADNALEAARRIV
jgi:aspartate-semialdehyde dehydrogenase